MAMSYAEAQVGPAQSPGPATEGEIPTSEGQEDFSVEFDEDSKFQRKAGQSLVDSGIGIMVAVVVIGAVAIPVVQDVIESSNMSGTAGDVLGYTPLALALALFVAAISLVR
jgi:hypothetical protein